MAALLVGAAYAQTGAAAAHAGGENEGANDGQTGLAGNAYQSPNWGYTLEWDEPGWRAMEVTSDDGLDTLHLRTSRSSLYLIGEDAHRGDPATCLDDWTSALSGERDVDNWQPLEDEDGEPVAGERRDRAWAAFSLTYANDEGDEFGYVASLECRTLIEDESTLTILHVTGEADYEAESEAVAEVLDTLQLPVDDQTRSRNAGHDASGKAARAVPAVRDILHFS
jgi:hypothetical protein